ncbi:hypothetical protein GLOTRDRAFT_35487 [Gloeophyllum trabeum ATCC 11539]|uniref:DUF4470 domain-containing protein n=1 Tax=Gloeophyllum trabeum (strain ATCC 11539 / FP-39264 / Madison 617) TaxID=670483 RepID=S7QEA0_GLOTA|nr:uncharacterized protein GLOTRDRAFT_35487 [Gloeophyllum trabeum ATCC 11539]EPQ57737.1 hypothetical protein GLOTRDRAFT_35487 [Gloeophyllum trabeum ATCC 11539]
MGVSQSASQPAEGRRTLPTSQGRLDAWIADVTAEALSIRSDRLLCANVEAVERRHCRKEGLMACSKCKLVSYCSQVSSDNEPGVAACQRQHWPLHKRDCKDPLMASDWKPAWERERRLPSFISSGKEGPGWNIRAQGPLMMARHLWGNMPAVDLVNLDKNEKDHGTDLTLACVASGDLRNVVQTVNNLPEDYAGHMTVVLNDRDPVVTIRTLILLCLLGTIDDDVTAAELALHFWYSVFLPIQYSVRIKHTVKPLIEQILSRLSECRLPFGSTSSMSFDVSEEIGCCIVEMLSSTYSLEDASTEYRRVRYAESGKDYHDRAYCLYEPAHRVALQEYRLFGLVLPFGALNAHFNWPNRSLFSPDCCWLQNDHVTPLESWDLRSVVEGGRRHGAQREDIFGCLYFFLTDQLRRFARRLRQFNISFHVFNRDVRELAENIRSGALASSGMLPCTSFDRIEVSNIMDIEYVGVRRALEDWGPLLRDNKTSAIIAYFMNWRTRQKGGDPATAGEHVILSLMKRLKEQNRSNMKSLGFFMIMQYLDPVYNNWVPFRKFLREQGTDDVLKKMGLRMKGTHTIVPHVSMRSRPPHPAEVLTRLHRGTEHHWKVLQMHSQCSQTMRAGIWTYVA